MYTPGEERKAWSAREAVQSGQQDGRGRARLVVINRRSHVGHELQSRRPNEIEGLPSSPAKPIKQLPARLPLPHFTLSFPRGWLFSLLVMLLLQERQREGAFIRSGVV